MVQVSTDKLVVEYREVPVGYFMGWYGRLLFQQKYKVRRTEYKKIFVYQLHIRLEQSVYLHVFYQNFRETGGGLYTLRLETRPEHYERFIEWLEEFRLKAAGIDFVSCDVAYDVPMPLKDVFVASQHQRRKLRLHKGTRYFGLQHQRKWNGYCRIYDKKLELWQRHGIKMDKDLTRIEIVYKPEMRILLSDIYQYPPEQSQQYFASVIQDWAALPAKRIEQIRNWQTGADTYTRHIRETIKRTLADRAIDFNQLASEQWTNIISEPVMTLLHGQTV
ncbi:replication initiation factor family protein [Paenibacillus sp. FSL P4-0338]|uniref:replication initiation factor family protein n=1 Tax=Paenibacillus sp. FSL P4-0338 TaxID=2921635 RepID=UPI0030F5DD8D